MDPKNPKAEAMVVDRNKIVYVGNNEEALAFESDHVIDLNGKFVLPGFVEGHCHPAYSTNYYDGVDVSGCECVEECVDVLTSEFNKDPNCSLIKGVGYNTSVLGVNANKSALDRISSTIPIVVSEYGGHKYWCNSRVLEMIGVDDDSEDPEGGCFERDENGKLTGIMVDLGAMALVDEVLPKKTAKDFEKGIEAFIEDTISCGITTIFDASLEELEMFDAYKNLYDEGKLKCRMKLAGAIKDAYREMDAEEQYRQLKQKREKIGNNHELGVSTVKFFLDGMLDDYSVWLTEPYADNDTCFGHAAVSMKTFKEIAKIADKDGFQVHAHAIGDQAVKTFIDVCEEIRKENGFKDARHKPAHCELIRQEDFHRMKELGLIPVFTTLWCEKTEYYYEVEEKMLGTERVSKEFPIKSCVDAGLKFACGSDGPVYFSEKPVEVQLNPLMLIEQGVTRCHPDQDSNDLSNVNAPSERVTVEDMVKAYTIDGAYALFMEDYVGSIEINKFADFVIMEKNIFDVPVNEIHNVDILETVVNGVSVYEKRNEG